jgi:serine/threonine protein kinase/Tol biopolymer transport system component
MIGKTINQYKIVSKIGEGGMGVVYKAEDTKLDRTVALKFLPSHLTPSESEKARFLQEAKAAAALNHPNVCTIYEIEDKGEQPFIAMEFVNGKNLHSMVGSVPVKPLSVGDALKYSIQIGDALKEAHGQGIVHRDIKSENIMLNTKGQIKVMDFGLAKLKDSAKLTKSSSTVGTLAYMAPEQIQGTAVDARSDIFSFGVVLFEMLTGHMPFKGDYESAVMYSILNEEPEPLQTYLPEAAEGLVYIIDRLLEKDPEDRYQSMADVVSALRRLQKKTSRVSRPSVATMAAVQPSSTSEVSQHQPTSSLAEAETSKEKVTKFNSTTILIGIIAILVVVIIAFLIFRPGGEQKPSGPIQATFAQLTDDPGQEWFPDISPDGNFIIYSKWIRGNGDIFLKRIGGNKVINLTEGSTEDDYQGAFSPDGNLIAFRSDRDQGGIYIMGATGESVRRLSDFGFNPAWSPDGKKIVVATEKIGHPYGRISVSELWAIDVNTGEKSQISKGDAVQPAYSPHGYRIAYWGLAAGGGQRDILTIPASGGEPKYVLKDAPLDWDPVWSPDGRYLYFSSDRGGIMNIWRIAIDEKTGETEGESEPLTTPSSWSALLRLPTDGNQIIYVAAESQTSVRKISFDPVKGQIIGSAESIFSTGKGITYPDISPDEKWIAFTSNVPQEDIYIVRTDGTGLRQLTNDKFKDRGPKWSPDGKWIAFYSDRDGHYEVWSIHPDGSGLEKIATSPDKDLNTLQMFPDGQELSSQTLNGNTVIIDLTKPLEERIVDTFPPVNEDGDVFWIGPISPNGNFIAGYTQGKDGVPKQGVYIYSMKEKKYEKLTEKSGAIAWLADNRRLLFERDGKISILNRETKEMRELMAFPENISIGALQLSRDNKTLYFLASENEADIWQAKLK